MPAAANSLETLILGPVSQRLKRASKIQTADEGTSETEPPMTKIRGPRTAVAEPVERKGGGERGQSFLGFGTWGSIMSHWKEEELRARTVI